MKASKYQKQLALHFTAQGYRAISNSGKLVARVDKPDWIDPSKLTNTSADLYRRVHSEDRVEITDPVVYRLIPNSTHDTCGYISNLELPSLKSRSTI